MRRLIALAVVVCGCQRGDAGLAASGDAVSEAKVTRGEIAERVLLTGELRAGDSVDLNVPKTDAWQLTIRWMIEDGTAVKAGDKVLEFDNSTFTNGLEEKRIAVVEANSAFRALVDMSVIAAAVKAHEVEQHRIALEKATILANVPADLLPQRTAQERALEKARAEVAVAKAEKELIADKRAAALEQTVKRIELEKAKRAIDAATKAIDELVLRAPREGVILISEHPWEQRRFQLGDTVQPGFTILTIPNLGSAMEVHAELSDVDDGRIAIGAEGTCTLDAYPREPLPCRVTKLAPVATNKNRESLRRAFAVTLALPAETNRDRMRPGMSVKVELVAEATKALIVPRGAIVLGGEPRVRLANGDLRAITLGACDAQRCAIEKGVSEGETVIAGGR